MTTTISIVDFLFDLKNIPLLDVRTPAEFAHAHIPGAFNLPIFTNEERVQVGTTYKQKSREQAILLGFDLTGPKWSGFIKHALQLSPQKKVAVHCWRGGMRSGAMAWALSLYGFEVYLIEGGYKSFRRWVIRQFEKDYNLIILGGLTGSGKTDVLKQLQAKNEQVIDLEDLAKHQGSSYGTMNCLVQPTQEQFENDLALQLSHMSITQPVWIEDESLSIGQRTIPGPLWKQMRQAPVIELRMDTGLRITKLANEYGKLDKEFLKACTIRIAKRLGPEQTKHAVEAIDAGQMETFVSLVLVYYDKTYQAGLAKREPLTIYPLQVPSADTITNAAKVLALANQLKDTIWNLTI